MRAAATMWLMVRCGGNGQWMVKVGVDVGRRLLQLLRESKSRKDRGQGLVRGGVTDDG